ncbi:MAG: methyltransferase domain-containing protein [Clostridiales bacterium]|nr:methyltransferase domain-containing protein [Clostridiales bacterium]
MEDKKLTKRIKPTETPIENYFKLDAGCGTNPKGDVNLDFLVKNSPHRQNKTINTHEIKNFILGDINHLPFRDKTFTESVCNHVLEHKGVKPNTAIEELIRCTTKKITITCPHYTQLFLQKIFPIHCHENVLTPMYFHQLLKKIQHDVKSIKWNFIYTRWGRMPFCIPNEMKIIIYPDIKKKICN